jgi:hypothetical protein
MGPIKITKIISHIEIHRASQKTQTLQEGIASKINSGVKQMHFNE